MEICVDFDGTCVKHEYPNVGADIGAAPYLKKLSVLGNKIILFTMRDGDHLADAVSWFKENGIPLYGVNENPTQKEWTNSPKAYGQMYIDDAALGIPLLRDPGEHERPYVDWRKVGELLGI
jgi:hypothetical protein